LQQKYFIEEAKKAIMRYFAIFILVTSVLAYYYIILYALTEITNYGDLQFSRFTIMGVFYVGVGASAFVGANISHRFIRRSILIRLWLLFAIISSVLSSLYINSAHYAIATITSMIWGITAGLGMPSVMASFADLTTNEQRGSISGLLTFVFNIVLFCLMLLLGNLSLAEKVQAFTIWLVFSIVILMLFGKEEKNMQNIKNPKLFLILREKKFILYWVPWLMFCLVNSLEAPILRRFFGTEFFEFSVIAEFAISGVCAIIGGFLADNIGRKPVAIIGFSFLGVGYALIGLLPDIHALWYIYVFLDGVSWGIFAVLFFIVLWADLAGDMLKDKYYLIGGLPFLLSSVLQFVMEPYIEWISTYSAFSLASFFLFLAVVPLMYAPETLPEKALKERELRSYIEKAKRVREKFTKD
jgi:MFS family permease